MSKTFVTAMVGVYKYQLIQIHGWLGASVASSPRLAAHAASPNIIAPEIIAEIGQLAPLVEQKPVISAIKPEIDPPVMQYEIIRLKIGTTIPQTAPRGSPLFRYFLASSCGV